MAIGGTITENELLVLRTYIPWTPPADGVLEDAYTRLGGIYQVAEEEIRRRLHERMAEPDSFTIPGDYAQRTGDAMSQLREALAEVKTLAATERATLAGGDGPIVAGRLVRLDSSGVSYPNR